MSRSADEDSRRMSNSPQGRDDRRSSHSSRERNEDKQKLGEDDANAYDNKEVNEREFNKMNPEKTGGDSRDDQD